MSTQDDPLKKALQDADAAGDFGPSQEETFRQMLAGTFRNQPRWMTLIAWVYILLFTAVAVVAAVQFFDAEAVRGQILWTTVFLVSGMIVMMLKMWFWMIMNRNRILREVKRLELRIAELTDTVGKE